MIGQIAARALVRVAARGITSSYRYARGVYKGQRGITEIRARSPLESFAMGRGAGGLVYAMRIHRALEGVGARLAGRSRSEYRAEQERETRRQLRGFVDATPPGMAYKYIRQGMK